MDDRIILRDRLNKIQKAVHKASEDAWKQHEPAVLMSNNNSNSNASFLLGMDLFGQDVSTLELNIRDKLDDVETELERLSRESTTIAEQPEEPEEEEDDDFDDPAAIQAKVDMYRNKIAFLKQGSLARTAIDESKTLASPTLSPTGIDLVKASRAVVQASELIRQAESFAALLSQDESSGKLIAGLKQDVRRQRVQLVVKAGQTLDSSVQLSSNSIVVKNAKQLDEAYQVMEQFERNEENKTLQETIRRFTKQLYQEILKPILEQHREGNRWKVLESEDTPKTTTTYTKKGTVHRLEWNRSMEDNSSSGENKLMQIDETYSSPPTITAWKETFALLEQILVFVQSKLLRNRQDPSQMVGNLLFGDPEAMPSAFNLHALGLDSTRIGADKGMLLEDVLHLLDKTCLPDYFDFAKSETTLKERAMELKTYAEPFCKAMSKRWFLRLTPKPKLIDFCDKMEDYYVDHRRCVLLNQARDILFNNDYHNTVPVGKNEILKNLDPGLEIFLMPSCCISDTAHKTMKLVRSTMDEAVEAQASSLELLRPMLYKTAREMLSLFRAIIPSSHQKEIRTVPRTAAVLHNDCTYFAHHCQTLGLEYKDKFASDLEDQDKVGQLIEQTCIFVDMVPLFRDMAEEYMGDMLELQKQQLVELIHPRISYFGRSLQSDESLHEWSEGETALAAGTYHLQHLQSAWQSILPKDVFGASIGHLADVVFASFAKQVLVPGLYISPSAKQFLAALFGKAIREIGELLKESSPSHCSSEWDRFVAISKFLEINSLTDLEASFAKGVFRYVTSQEMQFLVPATFREKKQTEQYSTLMTALANHE